jgi:hypothetical protein
LSQDARDELQALFYLGRDSVPFFKRLASIKTSGGGVRQIEYLYGKLLHGDDRLREGLRKIDCA